MVGDIFSDVIKLVKPYSMVPDEAILSTVLRTFEAIDYYIDGDLAEFGVWKGGCSFAMLLAQQRRYGKIVKPVWMFDSFQGLPAPDKRDGAAAFAYQADIGSPTYFDNCTASKEEVERARELFGFAEDEAIIVPGWFEDSLPEKAEVLSSKKVAVLRIDCDWYAPVKLVLDQVVPIVPVGGRVIIDDYFAWDGCARATHDFLSENGVAYRLRTIQGDHGAWFVKQHE